MEKKQRKKQKCPYCGKLTARRVAVGIFKCKKCDSKFTGKAYSVAKTLISEKINEEEIENIKGEVA